MTKKQIKELEEAGEQYFGDWKCWNEKGLNACTTRKEKEDYIHDKGHFEDIAYDLVGGKEGDADWAYEGIRKAIEKYLGEEK